MKILIVFFGLLAWIGGCHDETVLDEDIIEADATWTNMLASDGCSWHFTVQEGKNFISLLPSEASLKTIKAEVGDIESSYSFTDVRIKYKLTGGKRTVLCGWGSQQTYDEINVISIKKK
ncbi:hypothetical protein [Dyadobacter bucti]|jgi:hypothetical protein|uniref:hypothetical protein n=1 Tax=Dyadobacter bucti TaxID=2572203 RepID=UPI00110858E7|nr:hypothetical protein [Dyadobacter bucti]